MARMLARQIRAFSPPENFPNEPQSIPSLKIVTLILSRILPVLVILKPSKCMRMSLPISSRKLLMMAEIASIFVQARYDLNRRKYCSCCFSSSRLCSMSASSSLASFNCPSYFSNSSYNDFSKSSSLMASSSVIDCSNCSIDDL